MVFYFVVTMEWIYMTVPTFWLDSDIGVATITKFFTITVAATTVVNAIHCHSNTIPNSIFSCVLQQIHVIMAHPIRISNAFSLFFQFWLRGS
tara:strand:- start:35479 stop:35754 length:276 start_codon:yes stop_codon:yes gene_type:complete